ncbi:hypothetical protein [Wolbachia endosymbiont of Atemnus politus]|uniref:hypothetical protein n=1 Tax=Wolbachia endosymbiont of Atemnus politus TaxID=2682840 RepID=UPI001FE9C82E|nr:hypothetical protein [Wolbachia endosymbiont of Atemnus politus]
MKKIVRQMIYNGIVYCGGKAVIDVTSSCKKTESLVEKCKAISCLSDFIRDFVYTCILADCDPTYVNKIRPILENLTKKSE